MHPLMRVYLLTGSVGVAANEQYARPGVTVTRTMIVALVGRRSSRGPAAAAAAAAAARHRRAPAVCRVGPFRRTPL